MEKLSEILSTVTQGLTNFSGPEIDLILKNAQEQRQALYERYSRLYPDVYVSDFFLFEAAKAERQEKICASCNGKECNKGGAKFFKHFVTSFGGELYVSYGRCPVWKKIRQEAAVKRQFRLARIPERYLGKTFKEYKVDSGNANAVRGAKYILDNKEGLYLFGSPGTGKTLLAAILAQEYLERGQSVIFCDVPNLLNQMKSAFKDDSETDVETQMKILSETDILVLDDLGTEITTEWAVERLYLIVNDRYNAGKRIIVTSNYAPEVAAARLNRPKNAAEGVSGSRIISRLKQMCKFVKIEGTDRRISK